VQSCAGVFSRLKSSEMKPPVKKALSPEAFAGPAADHAKTVE